MSTPTFQEFAGLYDSLKADMEENEILGFEFDRLELHPQTQPVSTGNTLNRPQYVNQQLKLWSADGNAEQVLAWAQFAVEQWHLTRMSREVMHRKLERLQEAK